MKQERASQYRKMLSSIEGVLELFAQEQRNYMSAQANAGFLYMPEHYSVEPWRRC